MKLRWPFIVVEGYFRIIVGLLKENRVEKEILLKFQKQLTIDFSFGYERKLCEGIVEIFTKFPMSFIFPDKYCEVVETEIFKKFSGPFSKFLIFKICKEIFWSTSQNVRVHDFLNIKDELREMFLRKHGVDLDLELKYFYKAEDCFTKFSLIKSALVDRINQRDEEIRLFMSFR